MQNLGHASFVICALLVLPEAHAWPQTTAADNGVPALKVTAPNGAENLLIGSMHIPADGLRQPADSVMDGAKSYVVEGVPDPGRKADQNATAPEVLQAGEAMRRASARGEQGLRELMQAVAQGNVPGVTMRNDKIVLRANWALSLTEDQVAQLYRNAGCDPVVTQAVMKSGQTVERVVDLTLVLRSPSAAANIASRPCASPGLLSRDGLLFRAAAKRGLQPQPLETQEEVDKQRNAVPLRIHEFQLHQAFRPVYQRALQQTINSLNSGNYDGILKAINSIVGPAKFVLAQ
ncbi:hypothetical protein [Azohydromonas australica]|uniref:hypothetical protein n=1 Tax=Azohydromonas australica TaxID=364039 RepID=UPI0012EB40EE|nr:hypothetical protein [Azohydromonas australica]